MSTTAQLDTDLNDTPPQEKDELTRLREEVASMRTAIKEAHAALQAQQDLQDAEDMGRNGIDASSLRESAILKLATFLPTS